VDSLTCERISWAQPGLAGLGSDLASAVGPRQNLLLASDQGFCVASVGWTAYEAQVMAASGHQHPKELGEVLRLNVGRQRFQLCASGRLDRTAFAWLRLGYRLLHGCGRCMESEPPC